MAKLNQKMQEAERRGQVLSDMIDSLVPKGDAARPADDDNRRLALFALRREEAKLRHRAAASDVLERTMAACELLEANTGVSLGLAPAAAARGGVCQRPSEAEYVKARNAALTAIAEDEYKLGYARAPLKPMADALKLVRQRAIAPELFETEDPAKALRTYIEEQDLKLRTVRLRQLPCPERSVALRLQLRNVEIWAYGQQVVLLDSVLLDVKPTGYVLPALDPVAGPQCAWLSQYPTAQVIVRYLRDNPPEGPQESPPKTRRWAPAILRFALVFELMAKLLEEVRAVPDRKITEAQFLALLLREADSASKFDRFVKAVCRPEFQTAVRATSGLVRRAVENLKAVSEWSAR
jgi:hypothetical protein